MRECKTCKYSSLTGEEEPCRTCRDGENWEPKKPEPDNINHPAHYEGNTSLECIDVMEIAFGADAVGNFCLCNAFKYLWRYKHKGGNEDVKKAKWYLDRWTQTAGRYTECEAYQKMRDMAEEIV
jgi:hypothetical protein